MKWVQLYLATIVLVATVAACGRSNREDESTRSEADTLAADTTSIADSLLIVPGQSVGFYRLDDADSLLLKKLGKPDFSDAAMGKAVLVWHTDTGGGQSYPLSVFTSRDMGNDETARLKQIRITSPLFETRESLRVGSALQEITGVFAVRPRETYESNGASYSIYDTRDGIAFEVDNTDHCVSIIIHHQIDTLNSYLPLRGGY